MGSLLDRPPPRPIPLGGGIIHWPGDISSPPHGRGLRGGRSKIILSFKRARRKPDRNAYTARTARLIHPTSTLDRRPAHANHGSLAGDIIRTRSDDVTERADLVPPATPFLPARSSFVRSRRPFVPPRRSFVTVCRDFDPARAGEVCVRADIDRILADDGYKPCSQRAIALRSTGARDSRARPSRTASWTALGPGSGHLLSYYLPNGVKDRTLLDIGHQRIVDQGLIVPTSGLLDDRAEVIDDPVIQANRNLGFPRFERDYRTAFGTGEIDLPIGFSGDVYHIVTSDVCLLSRPR